MNNPFVVRFIEALPLPIFLIYAAFIDQSISQNWQGPYVLSSLAALLTSFFLWRNQVQFNHLFLGINLYLITGSLGLLSNQDWLNQLYGTMEASGMLAWIIIMGIGSLLFSPAGFIGILSPDRKQVVMFSLYLLLVALLAFLLSFYSRGHTLLSEYIPFLTVFAARSMLQSKMTKAIFENSQRS